MPQPQPRLDGVESYLSAVRAPGLSLRDRYKGDPVALAESLGLRLPRKPVQVMRELGVYDQERHGPIFPGLRELVEEVCTLAVLSAAVVGPRGGGKSQGVSFIEFYLVFIELFDALNLGGSELQADQVYRYLTEYIESDPYWQELVKGEPMASITSTIDQAWIRVLTASQKSVRSPHAGGRKKGGRMAGGILVIDEEAEADAKIVSAALPTINTARPSVNVRSSTFHNAVGSFADLIEDHAEMGYKLYKWDVFDVVERCEDECAACEPCFANDHWEDVLNPDTGQTERKLIHRAYCGGRAHYADGWVPVEEVKTLWRRGKRNHNNFEVEQMGSKPSSAGYVIKDMEKFKANVTSISAATLYVPRAPVTICVDWGSSNAGVCVWQEAPGDRHILLRADYLQDYGEQAVFGVILGYAATYRQELAEIACDIGGGGTYFNPVLREQHRLPVRDVDFAADKELAVGAWNIYNEAGLTIVPEEHTEFISQVKKWRRVNGRINKGGDHLCDSTICYFAKFVERLNLRRPHVPPKSIKTNMETPHGGRQGQGTMSRQPLRRPVGIRAIGR